MEMWRRGRAAAYGQTELKPTEKGVEVETINGHLIKHYNWELDSNNNFCV